MYNERCIIGIKSLASQRLTHNLDVSCLRYEVLLRHIPIPLTIIKCIIHFRKLQSFLQTRHFLSTQFDLIKSTTLTKFCCCYLSNTWTRSVPLLAHFVSLLIHGLSHGLTIQLQLSIMMTQLLWRVLFLVNILKIIDRVFVVWAIIVIYNFLFMRFGVWIYRVKFNKK